MNKRGFTFLEVLVAMLIFTLAALASLNIMNGSVRAVKESKEITQATWLLQNLMSETESKLESQGVDRACKEKETGKFPAPYEKYQWKVTCNKIDFRLSEAAAKLQQQMAAGQKGDDSQTENPVLKMILQVASEYLTRSTREVYGEVSWMQGKTPRQISATTHFARYDQQPSLPIPGAQ
jgi:type II secretion system protein I